MVNRKPQPVPKDFYSPKEVIFTRLTALWLINNLGTLRGGYWPPDASSYIDESIIKQSGSSNAPFVTPIDYAAEIQDRLEKCGIDGLILEALQCWGKSYESMAKYLKKPLWMIKKMRDRALGYVASGPARRWHNTRKRKGETYQEFKDRKKKKGGKHAI